MYDFYKTFFGLIEAFKSVFSVDTAILACRQSKIRDCRDTVDDRLSTTALLVSYVLSFCCEDSVGLFGVFFGGGGEKQDTQDMTGPAALNTTMRLFLSLNMA